MSETLEAIVGFALMIGLIAIWAKIPEPAAVSAAEFRELSTGEKLSTAK